MSIEFQIKELNIRISSLRMELSVLEDRERELFYLLKEERGREFQAIYQVKKKDVFLSEYSGLPLRDIGEFSEWLYQNPIDQEFVEWNNCIHLKSKVVNGEYDFSRRGPYYVDLPD